MQVKIVARTGRALGEAVEIRGSKFYIGSHDNCQLRPDLDGLAGIHALIEQRGLLVYLRDFGGEGGTGINDRLLHGREAQVFDGDLIQVGPMVLTLAILDKFDASLGRTPQGLRGLDHPHLQAPVGWPFLAGLADDPAPARPVVVVAAAAAEAAEVVPPPPHLPPRPEPIATVAAPVAATPPAPAPPPVAALRPAASPAPSTPRPVSLRALSCREVDGVLVATILSAGLEEEETVSPVRYELRSLIEGAAPRRMVIDLGHTKHLSSRAVGVFLAHYQAMERQGGTLRVSGVSAELMPVLKSMRLSMVVDVYSTVADAVADSWD